MTDRPMVEPVPWPPLIVASTKPTWVKVRDVALTLLMWLLFAIMLETEFELFFGHYLERMGLGDFDTEGRWLEFFNALRPFVQVALVLVSLLLVAGLLTLRRVARGRKLPQPAPLTADDEARRVGMDEAELIAARELRVVVVHIDVDGKYRVEPHRVDQSRVTSKGPQGM
jgi:poly-beta-1,6-N-acetyl-D-glucosamine biosynthesis protein PgaD